MPLQQAIRDSYKTDQALRLVAVGSRLFSAIEKWRSQFLRKYGTPCPGSPWGSPLRCDRCPVRLAVPAVLEFRDCAFPYETARRLFQRTGRNIAGYINRLVAQLTLALRRAAQRAVVAPAPAKITKIRPRRPARHRGSDPGPSAPDPRPPPSGF